MIYFGDIQFYISHPVYHTYTKTMAISISPKYSMSNQFYFDMCSKNRIAHELCREYNDLGPDIKLNSLIICHYTFIYYNVIQDER
jgi:hypothetical protein